MSDKPTTIAEYIEAAPEQARGHLRALHALLKDVAPDAVQAIKWGSPVYEEKRILFSFSAFNKHATFMPTRSTIGPFKEEIAAAGYETGADTIQLPYDKPVPVDLLIRLAEHRAADVRDNDARWMGKGS
jgi:uncharacterized protein YdhG (YjbR/CyaY superfamily)